MTPWTLLAGAIVSEITGTLALRASNGLSRALPTGVVLIAYATSFLLLSQVLKTLPVGAVYAIWSAIGTAAVAGLGWVLFGDELSEGALAGIGLIIAGVVLIQVFASPKH